MRRPFLLLALLVVVLALPTSASAQAPGVDPDACPGVSGPANGCPDQDADGIADGVDKCPALTNRNGPDRDADGCAETISLLRVTFDGTRACARCAWTSVRLTSLTLEFITPRAEATVLIRFAGCSTLRARGNSLVCRPTGARLRLPVTIVAVVRNAVGDREVHRVTFPRRGVPRVVTRR